MFVEEKSRVMEYKHISNACKIHYPAYNIARSSSLHCQTDPTPPPYSPPRPPNKNQKNCLELSPRIEKLYLSFERKELINVILDPQHLNRK